MNKSENSILNACQKHSGPVPILQSLIYEDFMTLHDVLTGNFNWMLLCTHMLFLVVLKMLDPFAGHSTMALNQGFTIRKDYGDAIFGWGWYWVSK